MPDEFFYLKQLFGGSGQGWFQVTLLASLFLVLIFRPERIENRGLFRTACLLLALAIIVPPALQLCMSLLIGSLELHQVSRSMAGGSSMVMSLMNVVEPSLLGASALCGLLSLMPGKARQRIEAAKHPLE
jgi:hypothetical protein